MQISIRRGSFANNFAIVLRYEQGIEVIMIQKS